MNVLLILINISGWWKFPHIYFEFIVDEWMKICSVSIWTVFLVFPFIVRHCVPLQVMCGIYTSPWLYLVWLLWSKVHTFHPLPDTQDKNTQAPGQCGQVKYPSTHPCPPDSSPHTWHGPKVHGAGGQGGSCNPSPVSRGWNCGHPSPGPG